MRAQRATWREHQQETNPNPMLPPVPKQHFTLLKVHSALGSLLYWLISLFNLHLPTKNDTIKTFKIGFRNPTECSPALSAATSPTMLSGWFMYCNSARQQHKSDEMLLLWRERIKALSEHTEGRNALFLRQSCTSHFVCPCAHVVSSQEDWGLQNVLCECSAMLSASMEGKSTCHQVNEPRLIFSSIPSCWLVSCYIQPWPLELHRAAFTLEQKSHWGWSMLCKGTLPSG